MPDNLLRAGSVDPQPADAAGRRAVRPPEVLVSRLAGGRPGVSVRPARDLLSGRVDPGYQLERHHAADGRGLRPVRERQDGDQVQPGQVHGSHHGDQQRPGPESAVPHDDQHDALVDRHEQGLRAGLRSREPREERRMRGAWTNQNLGKEVFNRTFDPGYVTGWGTRPYNWELGCRSSRRSCPASR